MFSFRKISFSLGLALLAAPCLRAQDDQPVATLHANSNLVVVDVTVTDEHHQPVHNLTAADFSVLEDGHAQRIKNFEEHSTNNAAPKPVPLPRLPEGTFTNSTPVPEDGTLNILLLDKLNTPLADQSFMRAQLRDYLKSMRPGTRIAIFGLTSRLRMLCGFTSDPAQLRAIVEGKKAMSGGSVLLNDSMNGDTGASNTPIADQMTELLGNTPDTATMIANMMQFEAEQDSFQKMLRVRYTLDAFNLLARYLANLPGRKNLLWFSAAFPINILPDGDLQNPFGVMADASDEFRQTTNMLARSRVAVYPVDARGLMTNPMYDVSRQGPSGPRAVMKAQTTFFQQNSAEQGTMLQLAEATGGHAFMNTNGLKEAVEKAIYDGENYYTLTYAPSNGNWRSEFRKIQIKLAHQGLTLNYRHGYYADDPNSQKALAEIPRQVDGKPAPSYDPLRYAMLHGGPVSSEIHFEAAVRPLDAGTQPEAVKTNILPASPKGPFRVYNVHFMVLPTDMNCDLGKDQLHHCRVQFMSQVYSPDGLLESVQVNGMDVGLTDAKFKTVLSGAFAYNQQISVPARGDYYLRVGVGDMITGRVGTLELPVATVARLQPVNGKQ